MEAYPPFDPDSVTGEGGTIDEETGQRRRWLICKGDYKYDPVTKEIIPELSPKPILKVSDEEREAARAKVSKVMEPPKIVEPQEEGRFFQPSKRKGGKKKKE